MSVVEKKNIVADDEQVARIVSHEWVIDGELQLTAFALAPRETYLSVNRPIVETYDEDVLQFVSTHPYYLDEKNQSYKRALLEVKGVRAISVEKNGMRHISEEYLLQQVQWELLELAELQDCMVSNKIEENKKNAD